MGKGSFFLFIFDYKAVKYILIGRWFNAVLYSGVSKLPTTSSVKQLDDTKRLIKLYYGFLFSYLPSSISLNTGFEIHTG